MQSAIQFVERLLTFELKPLLSMLLKHHVNCLGLFMVLMPSLWFMTLKVATRGHGINQVCSPIILHWVDVMKLGNKIKK